MKFTASTGFGLGLVAAPVAGALLGGTFGIPIQKIFASNGQISLEALLGVAFGIPIPSEPRIAGLNGLLVGVVLYGILLCIPMAVIGAITGGVFAANRSAGAKGNAERHHGLGYPQSHNRGASS